MLIIALCLTAPLWGRLFGYKRKPRTQQVRVSRNQPIETGPDWEQDVPWVLGSEE